MSKVVKGRKAGLRRRTAVRPGSDTADLSTFDDVDGRARRELEKIFGTDNLHMHNMFQSAAQKITARQPIDDVFACAFVAYRLQLVAADYLRAFHDRVSDMKNLRRLRAPLAKWQMDYRGAKRKQAIYEALIYLLGTNPPASAFSTLERALSRLKRTKAR